MKSTPKIDTLKRKLQSLPENLTKISLFDPNLINFEQLFQIITPTKLLESLCELKKFPYNLKRHAKIVENPLVKVHAVIDGDEVKVPRKEHLYVLEIFLKEKEGTDTPPEETR